MSCCLRCVIISLSKKNGLKTIQTTDLSHAVQNVNIVEKLLFFIQRYCSMPRPAWIIKQGTCNRDRISLFILQYAFCLLCIGNQTHCNDWNIYVLLIASAKGPDNLDAHQFSGRHVNLHSTHEYRLHPVSPEL